MTFILGSNARRSAVECGRERRQAAERTGNARGLFERSFCAASSADSPHLRSAVTCVITSRKYFSNASAFAFPLNTTPCPGSTIPKSSAFSLSTVPIHSSGYESPM
jgi:hypothetical protein